MTGEQERQLADLMRLAQRGDREAYGELLARLTPFARRYVRGRVGDVSWLEDVAQDILISVHRARQTYDPARAFASECRSHHSGPEESSERGMIFRRINWRPSSQLLVA